jgi:hypothetical protein
VEYGTTTGYGSFAPASPNTTPVTAHTQALTGLAPSTLYHYRVLSRDAANNLAVSGDFTFTTASADGSALHFDGTNDIATVNDSASLDLTTGFTLEAWVKFDSVAAGAWQTIIFKQGTSSNLAYALYYHDGLLFEIRTSAGNVALESPGARPTGVWHHIAAVYDGAAMRMYYNGNLAETRPQTGAVITSSLPLTLGDNGVWSNEELSGTLDEVRISDIVRYTSNFTPMKRFTPDADTMALYHFDEGAGQTSGDASSNANTLRLGSTTSAESTDPAWVTGAPQVVAQNGFGGGVLVRAGLPAPAAAGAPAARVRARVRRA